jgi:hypothetical protein
MLLMATSVKISGADKLIFGLTGKLNADRVPYFF